MDPHPDMVAERLRKARGHLDGAIRLAESGARCPSVMRQVAAVLTTLEGTNRLLLEHHLTTCVVRAIEDDRTDEAVDELMATLSYDRRLLRPPPDVPEEPIEPEGRAAG